MVTGIFSVTLKDLKQQADEFGLERKDKKKFLKEEWRKMQDAKLEKKFFEREERRLEKISRAKTIRSREALIEKTRSRRDAIKNGGRRKAIESGNGRKLNKKGDQVAI